MSCSGDDYAEIAQLLHTYADAVVHRNGVQWTSTWALDAVWDLGGGRYVEGIDAIKELWYGAMGGFSATVQTVLNGTVEVADDGQSATGRWYIQEHILRANGETGILLAHYDDGYTRVDGAWKFARRFLQPHYQGASNLSAPFKCTADSLRDRGVEGVDV